MQEKIGPNICFIVIDALRTKNMSCYGYSKCTTPNIDLLAREGVLFEEAYSCINFTDASLTTIFSGKYPTSHGVLMHGKRVSKNCISNLISSGITFLPEILKPQGYITLAVDWLDRWHKKGYDYYSGDSRAPMAPVIRKFFPKKLRGSLEKRVFHFGILHLPSFLRKHGHLRMTAVDQTDQAIALIERNCKESFFLFVHYWDTHIPYCAPVEYVKRYYEDLRDQSTHNNLDQIDPESDSYVRIKRYLDADSVDKITARYDGAIAYVDNEIGRLLEVLREYELMDSTLILITSDHGESLTEHGIFFDHHGLYDVSIHVPLVIKYSELQQGKRIGGFVQHFDLVPTILDILGLKAQNCHFDGKSAVPLINGEVEKIHTAIYAEEAQVQRKRAIRTGDYKYVYALSENAICRACRCVHGDVEELYDLNEDPEENQNIVKKNPKVANRLKKQLSNWIEFLEHKKEEERIKKERKPSESIYTREEEEKVIERLKSLGYF